MGRARSPVCGHVSSKLRGANRYLMRLGLPRRLCLRVRSAGRRGGVGADGPHARSIAPAIACAARICAAPLRRLRRAQRVPRDRPDDGRGGGRGWVLRGAPARSSVPPRSRPCRARAQQRVCQAPAGVSFRARTQREWQGWKFGLPRPSLAKLERVGRDETVT